MRKNHAEVTRMASPLPQTEGRHRLKKGPPNRREVRAERLSWAKGAGLCRVPGRKMAGREGFLGWEVGYGSGCLFK